jgi:hypothetical protein
MPITQPVEDRFYQFPDGDDGAGVADFAATDLVTDLAEPGVLADSLDGLHRDPAA